MRQRDNELASQMLQALDDPAAVITLSIMRRRGMPPGMAALEQPVLKFLSKHFEASTDGIWPAEALEAYRASSFDDQRITDAHFQHLFDWACMEWPPLSPLALAIWIGQNHQIPLENIEQAVKLLFPGATEQHLRAAKTEVSRVWRERLPDGALFR
jgi:hypothetical protein